MPGNGLDEHPTQAMADLFTIFQVAPRAWLKLVVAADQIGFRIGIVIGVPSQDAHGAFAAQDPCQVPSDLLRRWW